jgi:hypothetical protein
VTCIALVARIEFLLVVSLAEVAAYEGIARVEAGGNLEVARLVVEPAVPDLREPQTEPWQRIGLVEHDAFSKACRASAVLT